jgi:hypothetical protein
MPIIYCYLDLSTVTVTAPSLKPTNLDITITPVDLFPVWIPFSFKSCISFFISVSVLSNV